MENKQSDSWQTPQWLFDELSHDHGPFDIDLCASEGNRKCFTYWSEDYLNDNYLAWFDCPHKADKDILSKTKCAFMNPPYSNPYPFVAKVWEDSKHCKIVLLLKVDTSTKWWSVFWNYNDEFMQCGQCYLVQQGREHKGNRYCVNCSLCYRSQLEPYNGPKPGCTARFLPKRVQFDPPQELIDSREVWKLKGKWVHHCKEIFCPVECVSCKGKGFAALAGPTFPSCVVIMDRRHV